MKQTAPTTDTATQATLLVNILRAQRIPMCAMCAGDRSKVEIDGEQYIYCKRCGDCAPLKP